MSAHRGMIRLIGVSRPAVSTFSWWSTTSIVADSLWGSTPMAHCYCELGKPSWATAGHGLTGRNREVLG
jgi:hypothetical protein